MQSRVGYTAAGVAAILLWLLTLVLGLEALYILFQVFLLLFVLFGGSSALAERLGLVVLFVMGIGYLAMAIGTGEYHRKRVGQLSSWKVFGWTLAVEVALPILYYLVLA
jgi:hypothetical protein